MVEITQVEEKHKKTVSKDNASGERKAFAVSIEHKDTPQNSFVPTPVYTHLSLIEQEKRSTLAKPSYHTRRFSRENYPNRITPPFENKISREVPTSHQEAFLKSIVSKFDENMPEELISWEVDGVRVSFVAPGILQSIFDENSNCAIYLTKNDQGGNVFVISSTGKIKHKIPPPSGYIFSHLVTHEGYGPCVVCVGDVEINGWNDWHFNIDCRRGVLIKTSPCY